MRPLIITILAVIFPFFVSSCNESKNTKPAKTVDLKSIIKENNISADVNWVSPNEIDALMAKEPKKMMFVFHRPGCPYCKKMKDETLRDPRIIKLLNDNFYAVLFDGRGKDPVHIMGQTFINQNLDPEVKSNHDLHKNLVDPHNGNIYWPSTVFVNENYQKLRSYPGFQPTDQFLRTLQNMIKR